MDGEESRGKDLHKQTKQRQGFIQTNQRNGVQSEILNESQQSDEAMSNAGDVGRCEERTASACDKNLQCIKNYKQSRSLILAEL
jgi:hypothetical protein